MNKVLVVVANGSVAKIFKTEGVKKLVQVRTFEHPESHLKNSDLVSDRPGVATEVRGPPHFLQKETSPKLKEKDHFAEEISTFLQQQYQSGAFDHLYIIANIQFFSLLHHHLSDVVQRTVQKEIHKDLTLMSPDEIRTYLPPVL